MQQAFKKEEKHLIDFFQLKSNYINIMLVVLQF